MRARPAAAREPAGGRAPPVQALTARLLAVARLSLDGRTRPTADALIRAAAAAASRSSLQMAARRRADLRVAAAVAPAEPVLGLIVASSFRYFASARSTAGGCRGAREFPGYCRLAELQAPWLIRTPARTAQDWGTQSLAAGPPADGLEQEPPESQLQIAAPARREPGD